MSIDETQSPEPIARCRQVIESLVPGADGPHEERSDEYILTNEDFGLKFRNGKKLEIKVCTMRDSNHGIERFSKFKLGKKAVEKQVDDICQVLQDHGHTQRQEYVNMLNDPKSIVLTKRRRGAYDYTSNVSIEVCYLEVTEGKKVDVNCSRKWISACVEAHDASAIEHFLRSNPLGRALVDSLQQMVDFSDQQPSGEWPHIISGYPGWIKLLANGGKYDRSKRPTLFVK